MKKLVALLLSSVVIFTLAACGSTSTGSESNMTGQLTTAEDIKPWLEGLGLLKVDNESAAATQISITSGETTVYAELDHTEIAQEFAAMLPQTLSMQRVGGDREFYSGMDGSLNYDEAYAQTTFENGDLAYWFSGNGFCILYNNQVDEPEIESGIIVRGRVTSDLSVFYEMGDYIEVTIDLAE